MLNIENILNERIGKYMDGREDFWLNEIIEKKPDNVDVIVPISMFSFRHQLGLYGELLNEYNIKCLIKTKSPYRRISIWFYIISFTKDPVDKVVLSSYNECPYDRRTRGSGLINGETVVSPELTSDYIKYIDDINTAISEGKTQRDDIYIIETKNFDTNTLNPECYSPSAFKIKEEIINNKQAFKNLSEIAEINPNVEIKSEVNVIRINSDGVVEYHKTDERERHVCKLKKGDIVIKETSDKLKFDVAFIEEEVNEVYVDRVNYSLIRPIDKNLTQYIYFYLSDEKTLYYFMSTSMGNQLNHISSNTIRNIPVLIPTAEMINDANKLYKLKTKKSEYDIDDINKTIRELNKNKTGDTETKKKVSENIAQALSVIKTELAYQVINEDLKELDLCYNTKAYKASAILCGSVLEAILLDWLSEYEETDSIVDTAVHEGRNGRMIDMTLIDIINKLAELIKPYWAEKDKADEIRETRNYVHPKLYVRNNVTITEEDCKRIIDDLKDIISSRLNRQ